MTWLPLADVFDERPFEFDLTTEELLADLLYTGEERATLEELDNSIEFPVPPRREAPQGGWWLRFL